MAVFSAVASLNRYMKTKKAHKKRTISFFFQQDLPENELLKFFLIFDMEGFENKIFGKFRGIS